MAFKLKDSHWEVIISFMEENKSIATGRFIGPNGKENNKKLWQELAQQLNALGQGERSVEKWQKTWTDFKYLLKKKATALAADQQGTGGGPSSSAPLNRYEKRALAILGDTFFKGVGAREIAMTKSVSAQSEEGHAESSGTCAPLKRPNEHDYPMRTPSKRLKEESTEAVYRETIDILHSIEDTIDRGLAKIAESIDGLKDAILQSKT